jgi:rhamnose utilization protein RhaD (predicted bifunctional aldolase and dehydrogenase)
MTDHQFRTSVQKLCQKISKDRLIIQGAGGNVSWKSDTHLWIKLSGTWIEEVQNKDIFGSIRLEILNNLIYEENFVVAPSVMDQENVRPSIEVMLHAVIDKRFVFHLHMVEVIAALINKPEMLLDQLMQHDLNAQILPYCRPGEELARVIHQTMRDHPGCELLCLENHGVVLFSDDINEIETQITLLQKICQKELININVPPRDNISNFIENTQYELLEDSKINLLVFREDIYVELEHLWPICPDHLVFLGPRPHLYDNFEEFKDSFKKLLKPSLVFVKNQGIYFNREIFTKIHFIQLRSFTDILLHLDHFKNVPVISKKEIQKLLNWDAEKYRKQINQYG